VARGVSGRGRRGTTWWWWSRRCRETNRLLKLVQAVNERPSEREQDVVVATGEQVTIGLLSLAIHSAGGRASSFLAHQCRIVTDSTFSKARIKHIDEEPLRAALGRGDVAVVAGFQGIDEAGNVTTLGRGGSDTTAVALAAALHAERCEIYTDVDGVYTADPSVCPAARKLDRISYEEMLEEASLGAKVLQIRSVEFAMKYRVPLWVKSSFTDDPGTLVCEEDAAMEDLLVSGITYDRNEARLVLRGVPDRPGVAARIFGALDERHIVVDIIVQTAQQDGRADLSFTVGRGDFAAAREAMDRLVPELGLRAVESDDQIAKISIVGWACGTTWRGGADVRGPRQGGHQHPDDLHLGDQGLVRGGRQVRGAGGAALHTAFGLDRRGGWG
jgi:aspartate kinase